MDLHRADTTPEWTAIAPARRSALQRLAASTHGFVTVGNFFSLLGLISVPYSLWLITRDATVSAAVVIMAGRACDLIDGWAADKTHTKSPLGETIDASFDKVSTGLAVVGLIALGVVPGAIAVFLLLPQVLITTLALVARRRDVRLHPSRIGKLSMAALWVAMVAFLFAGQGGALAGRLATVAAASVSLVGLALGVAAMIGYAHDFHTLIKKT